MVARNDVVKRHSADRRRLEFRAIRAMVKRNREGFIRRLQGNVESQGGCVLWLGSIDRYGYGRMSVYYKKQRVLISVQRVFLILTLCRPIRVNYDAGHTNYCPHKHCVLHLFEQRSVENGREAQAKQHGDGVRSDPPIDEGVKHATFAESFRHEVKWAPDDPNINAKYSARVQAVGIKRGKITVTWSIYKTFTKGKVKK